MMKEYRDYLGDIIDSILSIERFVEGITIQEFLMDEKTPLGLFGDVSGDNPWYPSLGTFLTKNYF